VCGGGSAGTGHHTRELNRRRVDRRAKVVRRKPRRPAHHVGHEKGDRRVLGLGFGGELREFDRGRCGNDALKLIWQEHWPHSPTVGTNVRVVAHGAR
jgi:hypothetical protein